MGYLFHYHILLPLQLRKPLNCAKICEQVKCLLAYIWNIFEYNNVGIIELLNYIMGILLLNYIMGIQVMGRVLADIKRSAAPRVLYLIKHSY